MPRKGRELELIVKQIKEAKFPDARVESPFSATDIDDGESREVDVGIVRTVEGTEILIAVEVRDRKAKEDKMWIEQLITKKQSIGADVLIAVTSSAFSKGAQIKAKKHGILLRRVEDFTTDEIQTLLDAAYIEVHAMKPLYSVKFFETYTPFPLNIDIHKAGFLNGKTGSVETLPQMVSVCAYSLLGNLVKKIPQHDQSLVETYRLLPKQHYLRNGSELIQVKSIDVEIELTKYVNKVPVASYHAYKNDDTDDLIGEVVKYGDVSSMAVDKETELATWDLNLEDLDEGLVLLHIGFKTHANVKLQSLRIKEGNRNSDLRN